MIAGAGLGLLVSQINNYTLAPIDDDRISEAAGVNSASGSFGLSFGLAVAGGILLATLSLAFTNMTNASPLIPSSQQQQIAQTLEDDAQVVSNTQLDELLADEPPAVREEILGINTDATNLALQVALLVPILAGLLGLFNAFRMMRLPDIEPSPPSKQRHWPDSGRSLAWIWYRDWTPPAPEARALPLLSAYPGPRSSWRWLSLSDAPRRRGSRSAS